MTFLDEVPQDWSRPELVELRDLFVLAYRRPTAAEQLADQAGIVPGTFPVHDNMRMTWTELLREMGNQGKLRTLVTKAAGDPAAAAYQPRFDEMLKDRPPVAPPARDAGVLDGWKGDDSEPGVASRLYPERLMERRNRLIPIELAASVVQAARSVAKLSLRFGDRPAHGTGFLIGADLLLTNHHNVFHEEYGAVTSLVAEFDYEQGFRGAALVRRAVVESIVGDPDDDWAVLLLEQAVDRPPLKLGTPYDVGIDDTVVIIQHPTGAYKQFALEPLAVRHVDDRRVQYVADTQHGSSGSPVFNVRMHVIALHHAEAEIGVVVEGKPDVAWRNQGITITKVMSGLTDHDLAYAENT
jgi:S1-C subfamily serine protease